jgi:electron transport complex protein RnfG
VGNFLRLVGTLAAIALVASFGLSAVYNATHEITEEYKRQEQELARIEALACDEGAHFVLTKTDSLVGNREFSYYTAYASEGSDEILGYAFVAYGKGYSSTIETVVGMGRDGKICGIKITDQKETPGLGAKLQETASQNTLWAVMSGSAVDETGLKPWFQNQFAGLRAGDLRVVKSRAEDGILAITGATISSEAVTSSVVEGLSMLVSIVGAIDEEPGEPRAPDASGEPDAAEPREPGAVEGGGSAGSDPGAEAEAATGEEGAR